MENLIAMGAALDRQNKPGAHTALTWAACQNQADTVSLLLDMGANVNLATRTGTTALIEATYWGHIKLVRLLIRKGATVTMETSAARSPLLEACNRANVTIAKVRLVCRA